MPWIATNRGRQIDLENPQPDQIHIADIADGLARRARFAGLTTATYTVAQHSVLISERAILHPLEGLLHDAAEAYLGDIPRPVKDVCPDLMFLERRLLAAIGTHFGVDLLNLPYAVKHWDDVYLVTEKQAFQPEGHPLDGDYPPPDPEPLSAWPEYKARIEFLDRFHKLQKQQKRQ